MQAAKDAVRKITGKDGQHDTIVHEHVNPAITKETIHQNQEHRVTTALDKEVHQDHYHTSVQPVEDTKVLPEQHHHRMGEVEHRKFEHGNDHETKQRLADEAAQFKDSSVRTEGKTTHGVQPVAAGEHVHHHVHESIQPVVERQTVEPHVIHTTAPVHEVHHNAAQHHTASTLPAMTMDEFKSSGGQLGGRGERSDRFEGQPSAIGTSGTHGVGHSHTNNGGSIGTSTGTHGVGHNQNTKTRDGIATGSHGHNGTTTSTSASGGAVTAAQTVTGTSHAKPSLMDKMNPAKDADHDGVKGFMK